MTDYTDTEHAAPSDYAFAEQIGHLLRKAYQRHAALFQQAVGAQLLTAAQFTTLAALRECGPSSLTDLVAVTAVDQATIRGIVERLKARELISLGQDRDDRRKVIVGLTEAGRSLVDSIIPQSIQANERMLSGLNPAERIALRYLLDKLLADESA